MRIELVQYNPSDDSFCFVLVMGDKDEQDEFCILEDRTAPVDEQLYNEVAGCLNFIQSKN